ncbi:hypothetical protein VLK31_27410 [Variovorax sp. H27-G14]|uniref:hypothetical protein n=1 Tax=Variovorax sp. H27-G14 TaxID=3111914 RepID=UPI0038FC9E03
MKPCKRRDGAPSLIVAVRCANARARTALCPFADCQAAMGGLQQKEKKMIFNYTIDALKAMPSLELHVLFRLASEASRHEQPEKAIAARQTCLQVSIALKLRR